MRFLSLLLGGALLLGWAAAPAAAQVGYVYEARSAYVAPPAFGYGYGLYRPYGLGYGHRSLGYGYGAFNYSRYGGFGYPGYGYYGAYGRPLAPYGFGSPYYSGYNDPYFHGDGPGVQEFLLFGGADFYGW